MAGRVCSAYGEPPMSRWSRFSAIISSVQSKEAPDRPCLGCRYIVGKSRHRAHTESQREESGESQFQGSLWRATLSREAWMPIWGLSTESMKPWPPPGGGKGCRTKRRRWCGGTGVPGGHDTHRPFTNRKAVPGEGTVIRHVLGAPFRLGLGRLRAPSTSLPLGA